MVASAASWLFVLGDESIWVLHVQERMLVIHGPGSLQQHLTFPTEEALNAYHVSMTERLLGDGWILWGVDRDRRAGHDRRQSRRDTPDRRSKSRTSN
jgi:hypothetical protein